MYMAYPFNINSHGRTAVVEREQHIHDLIEQVLFTSPGERINRPEFGSGIMQLIFLPNNTELATANEFLIKGALQQWLGDLIIVEAVEFQADDNLLTVTVKYIIQNSQKYVVEQFTLPL